MANHRPPSAAARTHRAAARRPRRTPALCCSSLSCGGRPGQVTRCAAAETKAHLHPQVGVWQYSNLRHRTNAPQHTAQARLMSQEHRQGCCLRSHSDRDTATAQQAGQAVAQVARSSHSTAFRHTWSSNSASTPRACLDGTLLRAAGRQQPISAAMPAHDRRCPSSGWRHRHVCQCRCSLFVQGRRAPNAQQAQRRPRTVGCSDAQF